MPFTPINSTEIESGKPVSTTTQGKIKDNLDDHETRIALLESGVGTTYPPINWWVGGIYGADGVKTGIVKVTTNFPIELTGVRLLIDQAGTTGTTEIDIKFKRGGGAWTSLLTTKPSVVYSAGNDSISSNGVVNPTYKTLQAGDLLRLDTTSVQAYAKGFTVRIDYTGA